MKLYRSETRIFVNGTWVDVTGDVRNNAPIVIHRGPRSDSTKVEPSSCTLALDNNNGDYSPRNPIGAYFGSVGRNTPIQRSIIRDVDNFQRSSSNGWGTSTANYTWDTFAAGGSVLTSDWSVSSGSAVHSVPTTSAYRASYLAGYVTQDVDVQIDLSLSLSDITGSDLEPANILLSGLLTTDYYMVRMVILPDETITVKIIHRNGTEITDTVTLSGLTYSAGQALRIRAQAERQTLRAKIWSAAGVEPYAWHVSGNMGVTLRNPGWIGIRSGVASGNTNTKPIQFSYSNLVIRHPRFTGEISSWPQRWDSSGRDAYVPIEAAGVLRRLGQGVAPLSSTLRRGNLTASPAPRAYWPCEDGGATSLIASATGGLPMTTAGVTEFASYSGIPASAALPVLKTGTWRGTVPAYPASDEFALRFVFVAPSSPELADGTSIIQLWTTGTATLWEIVYSTGGNLGLRVWTSTGVSILNTGSLSFNDLRGKDVTLTLSGGIGLFVPQDLDWALSSQEIGDSTVYSQFGSITNRSIGIARDVIVAVNGTLDSAVVGHITVYSVLPLPAETSAPLAAYVGETAGIRLQRLCAQEGVPFSYVGDLTTTQAMGPQRVNSLLYLLTECVETDMGLLFDSRGEAGLTYRTRTSLYNQNPALALDYADGQITPPLLPVDDDQAVRNDVEVKRVDGGRARATLDEGPLSTQSPATGGVGRYDVSVTVNSATDDQLPDLAHWLLNLGTIDVSRYPQISINLGNAQVIASGIQLNVWSAESGDRLMVINLTRPHIVGNVSQLIRSYTEVDSAEEYTFTFACIPENAYQIAQLDTGMRIDTDTSILTSAITSSVSTFSVTTTDGIWTTDASEMPISIMVGGEEMSVTSITGAVTPQTFTVLRSINGIVKPHAAGSSVRVTSPAVLGL